MLSMAWLTWDRAFICGEDMICWAPMAALNAPPVCVIGAMPFT